MGPVCLPPWKPDEFTCPESMFPELLECATPATATPATPSNPERTKAPASETVTPVTVDVQSETLTPATPGAREALLAELPAEAAAGAAEPESPALKGWALATPRSIDSQRQPVGVASSRRHDSMCTVGAPTTVMTPTKSFGARLSSSSGQLRLPTPAPDMRSLRVVSLNLGGRNTNPLEFELKGDNSETAVEAASLLRKAGKALSHFEEGPAAMLSTEREMVDEIMAEISSDGASPMFRFAQMLLDCETWATVISRVKVKCPDLFNALNLATLQLKRPSVWEDPASCRGFYNTRDYLVAWKEWYCGLDRSGLFWLEDAPRAAKKREMDTATAFAGLLIFDLMSLLSARGSIPSGCEDETVPEEEGREVPFKQIAGLAAKLPSASLTARHSVAEVFVRDTHVLFAQEAREFESCPTMAEHFLAPFSARDNFTAVFLRKDTFAEVSDITKEVSKRMVYLVDHAASEPAKKAWRTSVSRLAAVWCRCLPEVGGFTACLVSLHCSKSDSTAGFMEALREVLEDYGTDVNIAGLDSNCSARDASQFQERLRAAGFEVGCRPQQNQVTVAKRRTCFQTQIRKIGETDISHKDYIVSWSSKQVCRAATGYAPDLRTVFGVDQETKQCVRLPTTTWPFDHCGVFTSFQRKPSRKEALIGMMCSKRAALMCCMVCFFLFMFPLPPWLSLERRSVYGPPGTWHTDNWPGTPRVGICEAAPPCAEGWVLHGGSCYTATPTLGYADGSDWCQQSNAEMVAISSEAENQFLTQTMCPEGELCWIGLLSDNVRETSWWESGEAVTYTRLELYADFLFPLFDPLTHGSEYKATVLSNYAGKVEGCNLDYAFSFRTEPDMKEAWVEILAPALGLVVTTVIILLPRPPHLLTTLYLVMAFKANVLWYTTRMWRLCFATGIGEYVLMESFGNLFDEGLHTFNVFIALWIIIQRMSVLQPARHLKIGFAALIGSSGVMIGLSALFVDTTTVLSLTSPVLCIVVLSKAITGMVLVVLGGMMSRDLYRAWRLMQREATNGKSGQVGTYLTDGIRAAEYHFYSVLAATVSAGVRVGAFLAMTGGMYTTVFPTWARTAWTLSTLLDSVTNDLCAYYLASTNMDGAILRAKGITNEIMERASMEVEQHRLAVHVLKAAPTSARQLRHLGELENKVRLAIKNEKEDDRSFLILQSAVRVETARIHQLMLGVRLRAMTMPVRYQYLIDVPVLQGTPRQQVPGDFAGKESPDAAKLYFSWLYEQARVAQGVLFHQAKLVLSRFNSTPWPSDLGLAPEQFPWTIWASGAAGIATRKLHAGETVSPGDILMHCQASSSRLASGSWTHCVVLEDMNSSHVRVHRSGMEDPEEVPRDELRVCNSGGVFIPGPLKKEQRCFDKMAADYEGFVEWPAAASLTDIARCTIVLDDPYAMAVLVGYIQMHMKVVRIKNRFSEDVLEPVTPEALQSLFNHMADQDSEGRASSAGSTDTSSSLAPHAHQYRDISINVEVNADGVPFVCEIQVTLSNLIILKHADQKLYSVRRMKSPKELLETHVFSTAQHSFIRLD